MIFSQERLENGTQLAVAEMPHVESVSVGFWLGVGGRHESLRQNGIFHFLEHMLFKGTTQADGAKFPRRWKAWAVTSTLSRRRR